MKVTTYVLEWITRLLKVPPIAVRMFRTANELSGLDKDTLPTELIPLNTIQLSRGLLNFTVLQSLRDWVQPFWVVRQYDPTGPSFVPRSHLGLSINVTHRNWTAVGNPECSVEPVVDPRGLVMPRPQSWSIDTWLAVDGVIFFPSKSSSADQQLVEDLPIVRTTFDVQDCRLQLTTFTCGTRLIHRVRVVNGADTVRTVRLLLSVRPFNPEGVSLVNDITYRSGDRSLFINREDVLQLSVEPDVVCCSSYAGGDCAVRAQGTVWVDAAHCTTGLANALAGFDRTLDPGSWDEVQCVVELQQGSTPLVGELTEPMVYWNRLLAEGAILKTPDPRVDSVFRSSVSTLLMLIDGPTITPGPFTYHQFWFRDAASMVSALLRLGFARHVREVIQSLPLRQESSGYFRSQRGEWDSNGQALWTIWQYFLYSQDGRMLESLFAPAWMGVRWIESKRLCGAAHVADPLFGLLPAGLSAEHLGLADFYFWDNWWSLAGLEAFIHICSALGRHRERNRTEELLGEYRRDVDNAVEEVRRKRGTQAIPAGPNRDVDCGMIGSCCPWYPLQLLPPDDPRMIATLEILESRFFQDGMFFQEFIHSGLNAYLTLHVAQAWLHAGRRQNFWKLLSAVIDHASPTQNFPEAIHPLTGGGCMGEGHHGWAAAEVALALRNAFVYEISHPGREVPDVRLLAGIPEKWFGIGTEFSCDMIALPHRLIGIHVSAMADSVTIRIRHDGEGSSGESRWRLCLPFPVKRAISDAQGELGVWHEAGEAVIHLMPGTESITVER